MSSLRHVAVIMDGNRRWASSKGLSLISGYQAGLDSAIRFIGMCRDEGIKFLTLYALSAENFSRRSESELRLILHIAESSDYLARFIELGAKVSLIGNIAELPVYARTMVDRLVINTQCCDAINVQIALNYGGRQEILAVMRKIAEDLRNGVMSDNDITLDSLSARMYTGGIPDPDLVIRTGCTDRIRVSNFMLWQIAYSELYFSETMWPDYSKEDFIATLDNFRERERMFGA